LSSCSVWGHLYHLAPGSPRRELLRYRSFLGIQKEQQNIKETEKEMKARYAKGQDFTSPDIGSAIQAAKTAETPIDGCASWPLTAFEVHSLFASA